MGFADEMEQFDEQWEDDQANPRTGGARLPDGPHQVMIVESRIEHDKADDKYTWVMKFQNAQGTIRKWNNLDNEIGRSIAAQDALMLGYEGRLSGLEKWMMDEGPIHLVVEINVKTKAGTGDRDFVNVYINRCLGPGNVADFVSSDEGAPVGAGSLPPDDDIPF